MGAGCGSVDCGVHAADGVGGLVHVLGGKVSHLFELHVQQYAVNKTHGGDDRSSQVHSISGKLM